MSRLSTSLGVAIAVFALTAGGATLVLSATPTVAEKNQAASEAASQSDFELARNIWEPLAKGGNAEAQYNLGSMYYFVNGVAVDFMAGMVVVSRAESAISEALCSFAAAMNFMIEVSSPNFVCICSKRSNRIH